MSEKTYLIATYSRNGRQYGSLYYYNGNFYYPLFLAYPMKNLLPFHVRKFTQDNRELVRSDRAHPDYKNKVELSGL